MALNKKTFSLIVIIFLIQTAVFFPSLDLAIFGDDWLTLWRYIRVVKEDAYHQGFTFLSYFLTPYGPQDITFGLIYDFFGLNNVPYYVISFLFRFGAAGVIFGLIYKMTDNIIASLVGSLFFAITTVGLDTTNWIFNMPNYLGVLFLTLFLFFNIGKREDGNRRLFIFSYAFLLLAVLVSPIRMHGTIPLIFATEIFWVLIKKTRKDLIESILRIVLYFVTIFFVRTIGTSLGDPGEPFQRIAYGFQTAREMFTIRGQKEVYLIPLTIFGNMVFPEALWESVSDIFKFNILGRVRMFPVVSSLVFTIYLILVYSFLPYKKKRNASKFTILATAGILFNILIYYLYKESQQTFAAPDRFGSTLIGGYFLLYLLGNLILVPRTDINKLMFFTAMILPLSFMGYPWIFTPYTIFPAAHRYMLIPGLGISLILGFLLAQKKIPSSVICFSVVVILFNIYLTNSYLRNLVERRGIAVANAVWNPIDQALPKIGENDDYYVAYFEPDNQNGDIVHANVSFGFPPRIGLRDNIINLDKIPVAVSVYGDLVEMVKTGEPLVAHAKEVKPLPVEKIYGFKIIGNDSQSIRVENITEKLRSDLQSAINRD